MKVLSVLAVAVLLAMPALQGCSMMPQSARHEVVPVKQKQVLSMTIIEGKTTKKEVLDALGDPDRVYQTMLSYCRNDTTSYKIHLIQKDGTQFDFEVGDGKKYSFSVNLDSAKNYSVVSGVRF